MRSPSTSVCISTHNNCESLKRTLESLAEIDRPRSPFEVIVVDNASTDATSSIVGAIAARYPDLNLRYVHEPRLGLQRARHAGLEAARHDIIIFTDDDVLVPGDWLTSWSEAFATHPTMQAAGGRVVPDWEVPPEPWLTAAMAGDVLGPTGTFPILALIDLGDDFTIGADGTFFGVNMAFRRGVVERHGGFRPELVGRRCIGSGEWGLLLELRAAKCDIGWVPTATVRHQIPARRMTRSYVQRWAAFSAPGDMFERWHGRPRTIWTLTREIGRIAYWRWQRWLTWPIAARRSDPQSILAAFEARLGVEELRYVWWMITDPAVRNALDQSR